MAIPHLWQLKDIDDSARMMSWLQEIEYNLSPVNNVKALGAAGDGVQDDTQYIQKAIDDLPTTGGTVFLPIGVYKITSTLTIGRPVQLVGTAAAGYFFNSTSFTNGSILKWAGGASPVLKITPSATNAPVVAPRVENVCIDGQSTATYCLRIEASVQPVMRNVALRAAVTAALYTGQTALGGFTGLNYVYGGDFGNIWIDQNGTGLGDGLFLDGNATGSGDTTFCRFRNILVSHKNGNGVTVNSADTNLFEVINTSRQAGGSGIGIELKNNTGGGNPALNNIFSVVYPGAGGVTARAGTSHSRGNVIFGYSLTDSAVVPTIESGAGLVAFGFDNAIIAGSGNGAMSRDDVLTKAQGFKGENFTRALTSAGAAVTTGTVYFMGVPLLAGEVVTNVHPRIVTLGAGITACKVGLYSKAGVQLAASADLGTSWQTGGLKTHAFATPYVVPSTDIYYIALFCTFVTTAPQPLRGTAVTGSHEAVGAGSMLLGAQTGQVDLPAPATIANSNQIGYWVGWS